MAEKRLDLMAQVLDEPGGLLGRRVALDGGRRLRRKAAERK